MKPEKKIEAMIKHSRLDTHSPTDEYVLADMIKARQQTRSTGAGDIFRCSTRLLRLAAMILLALIIGFVMGQRRPLSSSQKETLCSMIEAEMQESLKSEIQTALLADIDSHLKASTDQILATSETQTTQRLQELIDVFERARMQDRQYTATALDKLQTDRLQDKRLFGRHLTALALQTQDLLEQQVTEAKGS